MNAMKEAAKLIAFNPQAQHSLTLGDLIIALEAGESFALDRLYALDLEAFNLGVKIIEEWRIDRYYARRGKLLDMAVAARELMAQSDNPSQG